MNAFSADWLALREPYDRFARNPAVLAAVADAVADLPSLRIVDLACGTGSTMRAIAPHLSPRQSWRLVDNNLSLLARVVQQDNVTVVAVDVILTTQEAEAKGCRTSQAVNASKGRCIQP